MRKSQYGKELIFLWEGWKDIEEVQLVPTASTLLIEDELQEKIDAEWEKVKESNPHAFDGLKWRFEQVHDDEDNLSIDVSESRYSQHNVLRHEQGQPVEFYPNPISANTIQETSDGYILLGVRGRGSDQKGLCLMGSGFVERRLGEDNTSKKPGRLGYVIQEECLTETKYHHKESFDITDARVMNLMFGSNHDTSIGVHLPIFATHDQVSLNGDEHSDLLFLPNRASSIRGVLNRGTYRGIAAADHLLGSLESYLTNLGNGNITPAYQHK